MGLEKILEFLGIKPRKVEGIPFNLNHIFDDETLVIRPVPFYKCLPTRTVEDRIYRRMYEVLYWLIVYPEYQALQAERQRIKRSEGQE